MNEQLLKELVVKCKRRAEIAKAGAFLLVGIDREAIGMGDGAALAWKGAEGKWKMRFLNVVNRDTTVGDTEDIITDDDLYGDEPDEDEFMEEDAEEAADCQIWYSAHGADVRFHAHVNRTNDGLRIKEDFVSQDRGDGPRELPIVYWNTGGDPVKADGKRIPPNDCLVSLPTDPARIKRMEQHLEGQRYLNAFVIKCSEEQAEAELQEVQEQIMELKPDWTEAQARKAAEMFLKQKQGG